MRSGSILSAVSTLSVGLWAGAAPSPQAPAAKLRPAYDLVVYGGTPAGVACAVRAAREGLSVLLVNHTPHLGGLAANGLTVWDTLYDGPRSPIFDETRRRIVDHYKQRYGEGSSQHVEAMPDPDRTNPFGRGLFEPHVGEGVLTGLVAEARNVDVLLRYYPVTVEARDRVVLSATFREMDGTAEVRLAGAAFADASYEGDLLALAKARYRVGRESRDEYGEEYAGVIFTRDERAPGQKESILYRLGLRPWVQSLFIRSPKSPGTEDRAIQAYNYRPFLTRDPKRRRMPWKPARYRREDYLTFKRRYVGDGRQTINDGTVFNAPILVGENHDYPEADWPARRRIMDAHWDWCIGLLYFIQNDSTIPAEKRREFSQWGLPKDEFADNENRPWELYVREARRLVGRAVFREQDARKAGGIDRAPIHADSITITEWPLDSHACTKATIKDFPYEGKMNHSTFSLPGQVPYRCLLPQELDNLLVPLCLSATHVGWGSIRLEPVWMSTGEAAGWAAALARKRGTTPGRLDPDDLQRTLVENGFLVSYFTDAAVGFGKPWVAAVQWAGTKGFFASYDAHPDRPLALPVAERWAAAFAALAAGTLDPMAEARKVHAADPAGEAVTAGRFRTLLETALDRAGRPRDAVARAADSLRLDAGAPIARGDACRLMERASISVLSINQEAR